MGLPWSSRDSAVQMVTSLASRVLAEPSGCLPARPATSEVRMGTPVPSMPRYMVGATWPAGLHASAFVSGDLGTQRFGGPFYLTGAYLYPCQFAQQTAALDKAHQRCRAAGHA